MAGFETIPQSHLSETEHLRARVADLESQLDTQRKAQRPSDDNFLAFAQSSPVMIWMSGPDARFSYCNPAWLDFRGLMLEMELGEGWMEGVHPDDRELCREAYLRSFSVRQPFRMQYRMQRSDGEYVWLEFSGVPRYNNGHFGGFMGSALDVSHRKRGLFTPDEEAVRMLFSLTERERQVLVLIAEGRSTRAAAEHLGISYKTADSHRSRILEKLGIHETASMVRYAIRAGLIEP